MAPTEGRVARPERQWGCRRGTPIHTLPIQESRLLQVHTLLNLTT